MEETKEMSREEIEEELGLGWKFTSWLAERGKELREEKSIKEMTPEEFRDFLNYTEDGKQLKKNLVVRPKNSIYKNGRLNGDEN